MTPWTVACQAPLSMGSLRQEYWGGLPFSSSGDLPDPETEPASPALAGWFFTNEPMGKLNKEHQERNGSGSPPLTGKGMRHKKIPVKS